MWSVGRRGVARRRVRGLTFLSFFVLGLSDPVPAPAAPQYESIDVRGDRTPRGPAVLGRGRPHALLLPPVLLVFGRAFAVAGRFFFFFFVSPLDAALVPAAAAALIVSAIQPHPPPASKS